jgi:hypothetical protein
MKPPGCVEMAGCGSQSSHLDMKTRRPERMRANRCINMRGGRTDGRPSNRNTPVANKICHKLTNWRPHWWPFSEQNCAAYSFGKSRGGNSGDCPNNTGG